MAAWVERGRMNNRISRGERREPSFGYESGDSRDDGDMRLSPDDRPVRFDVVSVLLDGETATVDVYVDAFRPGW